MSDDSKIDALLAQIDLERDDYARREMRIQRNKYEGIIPEKSIAEREAEYLSRVDPLRAKIAKLRKLRT